MIGSLNEAVSHVVREAGVTRGFALSQMQDACAAAPGAHEFTTASGLAVVILAAGVIGTPPHSWRYAVEIRS